MAAAGTPSFFKTHPRVAALVLASSNGSRLFPMTSSEMPKHLLPIAGIPSIIRLLEGLSYVAQVVIAVSAKDSQTVPLLQGELAEEGQAKFDDTSSSNILAKIQIKGRSQMITVVRLSPECFGPVDALREVEETNIVHPATRLLVVPGDLVFLQKDVDLNALLYPQSGSDCTILLVDVGEVDEHGVPLKESAKVRGPARCEISVPDPSRSFLISRSDRPRKELYLETKKILNILEFRIH